MTRDLDAFALGNGDCLELMKDIPDASVDLILCDLPYGTTACPWDSVIPFGPLWEQYRRVTKPSAAIVLTASQPFTSALIMSNPGMFKYCWEWEKENGTNFFFNAKHQPLKVHEDIAVFSKAAASHSRKEVMSYFPQKTTGKPYKACNNQRGLMQFHSDPNIGTKQDNDGTRYPRSVLRYNSEWGFHPTQKPVALMEYLIRTYTNEGDTVLDNCMGSGTTGVACVNTGRRFIGIEKDEQYFKIAKERIEKAREEKS